MASVVAVIVSNVCLLIFVGLIKMGVVLASTLATTIAAVPSYEMNRKWAWGKSGKSHMMKEVVPFWGLAILGWAFSTWAVWVMDGIAKRHHLSHGARTLSVAAVYLGAFGVLWIAKFIIFNKVMFVHHHHDADPAPADHSPAEPGAATNGTATNGTATNGTATNGSAAKGVTHEGEPGATRAAPAPTEDARIGRTPEPAERSHQS
jgi:putative flippase GtrA